MELCLCESYSFDDFMFFSLLSVTQNRHQKCVSREQWFKHYYLLFTLGLNRDNMKVKVPISCLGLNFFPPWSMKRISISQQLSIKHKKGYKLCEVWLHLHWSFDVIWIEKSGGFNLYYKTLRNALSVSSRSRRGDGRKLAEVISFLPV